MLEVEGDPTLEGEMVHHWGWGVLTLESEGVQYWSGRGIQHWRIRGSYFGG